MAFGREIASSVCAALALVAVADVRFAGVFSKGVVLQRERPVRIWGAADPGAAVQVCFAGQDVSATADAAGRWMATLAPLATCRTGRELVVISGSGRQVVPDVLVGEVWFCAGQSNVNVPIWSERPRYRDGQGALVLQMVCKPHVRIVRTPLDWSRTPKDDVQVVWRPLMAENFPLNGTWQDLPSALGFYYALELSEALEGVPIGVVCASQGGSLIQSWTPGYPPKEPVAARGHYHEPSSLWNAMVAPYVPMAMRGLVWYQGESNLADGWEYVKRLRMFYDRWAQAFQNPSLSLGLVQIAPHNNAQTVVIQEAQAAFAKEEPRARLAVISDVGNMYDIHPNDKRTPARRLAALALRHDYGWTKLRADAPVLRNWTVTNGAFRLSFDHAEGWYVYRPDNAKIAGFEVAGADGDFVPANILNYTRLEDGAGRPARLDGRIDGPVLVVGAKEVPEPKRLRYLYAKPWTGTVFNESSLPLGPFHIGE